MRDSANWAFQTANTETDAQTRLAIAALGNEAATDAAKSDALAKLGKLAVDLWKQYN